MRSAPRIAFITHGGPAIGLGHVCRCLALGRAFAADGADVRFLVNPEARVAALVRRASVAAVEVPWEADPGVVFAPLTAFSPDVVVVDSYRASAEFLAALHSVVGQVVAVDDLADRPLPVHIVVNGGVAAETLAYGHVTDAVLLLGPRYALVDPRFAAAPGRSPRDRVQRVFVSLGGGHHPDALATAAAAVEAVGDGIVADIALGPFASGSSELDAPTRRVQNRVFVHRDLSDLRRLMLAADVAISAAGMTLYELAATATPTVVVCMADNQIPNADGFERAGAALRGGSTGDSGLGLALEASLRRLVADRALRATLGGRARDLVDGRGASRGAREIASLIFTRR